MSKNKKLFFRLSPEWAVKQYGKVLNISGGADAKYEIELETDEQSFFSTLEYGHKFLRSDLGMYDNRVLEELLVAEIVVPALIKTKSLKVAILGDSESINLQSNKNIVVVSNDQTSDILIVVRAFSTYASLLNDLDYQNISKPHLFIDLAFHHNLSIGPLVFPGETSCISCLQGRVVNRWGDEEPPKSPKMVDNGDLAVAIVISELQKISQGDTSLTNKTIAWNFQDRIVKKNQLLKVSLCPICTHNKIDHNGSLVLPWSQNESISYTV